MLPILKKASCSHLNFLVAAHLWVRLGRHPGLPQREEARGVKQ